ncbi:MAG: hypothetical protein ACSHWW_05510 [Nonlabens sp.]|uniref:hypothetical protein n=1 Tax=Nonlabens sp. TaxID=1888209 RepID=UPI003EF42D1F
MKTKIITLAIALFSLLSYSQLTSRTGDVRLSDIYGNRRVTIFKGGDIVISGTLYIDTSLYLHSTKITADRIVIGNPNQLMFVNVTKNASITAREVNMPFNYVYFILVNEQEGAFLKADTLTGAYAQRAALRNSLSGI